MFEVNIAICIGDSRLFLSKMLSCVYMRNSSFVLRCFYDRTVCVCPVLDVDQRYTLYTASVCRCNVVGGVISVLYTDNACRSPAILARIVCVFCSHIVHTVRLPGYCIGDVCKCRARTANSFTSVSLCHIHEVGLST